MKPYYQDKYATIFHGDCLELLPEMPKVDLVLTDPPYGESFYKTDVSIDIVKLWSLIESSPNKAVFGYPETLVEYSVLLKSIPDEWVTW